MLVVTDPKMEVQAPGTTAAAKHLSSTTSLRSFTSPGHNLQKWQKLFHDLPAELHVNIMARLHGDPVSQICFGLASSYFYWQVFHEVFDKKSCVSGEKEYLLFSRPFDLRFQVSHCGQYSVFGWWDYGNLLDTWDIVWNKSLGELLWEEKSLWHDLTCCNECQKFKPKQAFGPFEWEMRMMKDARAWPLYEERKSLGLRNNGDYISVLSRTAPWELLTQPWDNGVPFSRKRYWAELEAYNGNYETWEAIFEEIGF